MGQYLLSRVCLSHAELQCVYAGCVSICKVCVCEPDVWGDGCMGRGWGWGVGGGGGGLLVSTKSGVSEKTEDLSIRVIAAHC
jgi:hypothetical protein